MSSNRFCNEPCLLCRSWLPYLRASARDDMSLGRDITTQVRQNGKVLYFWNYADFFNESSKPEQLFFLLERRAG